MVSLEQSIGRNKYIKLGCEKSLMAHRARTLVSQPHCCAGAIGQFLRKRELQNLISRNS